MATPVSITIAKGAAKSAAVRAAGSTADTNVIIEVDEDLPMNDVVALLRKAEAVLIEKYGTATS